MEISGSHRLTRATPYTEKSSEPELSLPLPLPGLNYIFTPISMSLPMGASPGVHKAPLYSEVRGGSLSTPFLSSLLLQML